MKVTKEHISKMMKESKFEVVKIMDRTTVVACQLPNGFIIVESSSCADPKDYNRDLAIHICKKKIESRLYELEGYRINA